MIEEDKQDCEHAHSHSSGVVSAAIPFNKMPQQGIFQVGFIFAYLFLKSIIEYIQQYFVEKYLFCRGLFFGKF